MFCFTESWLNPEIPNFAFQLPGSSLHVLISRPNSLARISEVVGPPLIDNRWCMNCSVLSMHSSSDIKTITLLQTFLLAEGVYLPCTSGYVHPPESLCHDKS